MSESRLNSLGAKLLSAALGVKLQKILLLLENRQWLILAWGRILRLNLLTLLFKMKQGRHLFNHHQPQPGFYFLQFCEVPKLTIIHMKN